MAREQVRELATRGVRPSSIQAGTTPVVVQQAAEPAVMGLARGLAGVNKALGHYTNIVEHASASEEARIRSMTAEERKAELEKMEANFDKMERKGQIPFLSNPVSWKRKSRALGVGLANDLYNQMNSDTGRLKNPEEGDENLTLDEIMGQEIGQFFEDNPQLHNQPTVIDEFYRAFDVKSNAIQSQYGDRQATQIKNGIIRERTTQIYDLYKDLVLESPGDQTIALQTMQEAWGEMGFLTPELQLKIITNIAKSLADNDPEAVEDFLEAAKSLKVGNTTFGKNTKAVDDIDTIIADRLEDNEEKDRKKKNRDRIEQDAADDASYEKAKYEFHSFASQINSKGSVEYKGESYTSLAAFREAYLDKMASDYMDSNRALHGRIAQYVGEEWSPITRDDTATAYILQQSSVGRINQDTDTLFTAISKSTLDDIEVANEEMAPESLQEVLAIQSQARVQLAGLAKDIASDPDIQGLPTTERIKEINKRYKEASDRVIQQTKESIESLKARKLKVVEDKQEAATQLKQEKDAGKVVSTKGVFGRTLPPLETIDRLTHNLALLTEEHPDADKEKAIAEIKRGEDLDLFVRIANGQEIKEPGKVNVFYGGVRYDSPAIPYSDEERKQALDYVILRKAMAGEFTNLEVLQQQRISKIGAPFDPRKLNPNIHYILTEKEIESGADDPVVIEKAGIIGYDPEDLVEAQKETYKKIPNLF